MTLEFDLGTNSQNLAVRAFIVLLFPFPLGSSATCWIRQHSADVSLAILF